MQQIVDKEIIQLQFKAVGLQNRDFQKANNVFCKIFLKNGNNEELQIAQTDVARIHAIASWEIYFVPFTQVEFQFEQLQQLRIEIYEKGVQDLDQLIASVITNIGQIISSIFFEQEIFSTKKIGTLNIRKHKEIIEENNQTNFMIWEGHNLMNTDFLGDSDPFLIFHKMKFEKWEKILETDYIKDNLNPTWKAIEISDDQLYRDNPQQLIKIECWDNSKSGKHNFIGEVVATKADLSTSGKEFVLANNGKTKGIGTLKLVKHAKGGIPKFLDYLLQQEKLNPIIGIDFTGSNGNSQSTDSLHYLNNQKQNQYQQTLKSFCDILQNYTKSSVEMFGFGGIPKGKDKTKFCFSLNDNEKHPILNTNEVLQVYHKSVTEVKLSGPTYVAEIVKYAKEQSKKIEKDRDKSLHQQYFILLIITDGIITDMAETLQLLTDCQQLPLSVVFIGVGNEDFSEMRKTFKQPDVIQNNYRQIVQFESFKDYEDAIILMQNVLQKIPEQYLKYKKLKGRAPQNYFNK